MLKYYFFFVIIIIFCLFFLKKTETFTNNTFTNNEIIEKALPIKINLVEKTIKLPFKIKSIDNDKITLKKINLDADYVHTNNIFANNMCLYKRYIFINDEKIIINNNNPFIKNYSINTKPFTEDTKLIIKLEFGYEMIDRFKDDTKLVENNDGVSINNGKDNITVKLKVSNNSIETIETKFTEPNGYGNTLTYIKDISGTTIGEPDVKHNIGVEIQNSLSKNIYLIKNNCLIIEQLSN